VAVRKKVRPPSWEAQSLRLTIFLSTPFAREASLWKDLTGEGPESDDHRPREGLRRQVGTWQDRALEFVITNPRIDLVMAPLITPAAQTVTMGSFATVFDEFGKLVRPWMASAEMSCIRIAIGAALLSRTLSREASYALLGSLVPSVKYDAVNSREAFYRVNRPKTSSTLKGLELNRVTTWTGIRTRQSILNPGGVTFQNAEQCYARLECDHSTHAERIEEIPKHNRVAMYDELAKMVLENAKSGELA